MNMDEKKPELSEGEKKKYAVRLMAFQMATEFAVLIALPLIIFVLLGRWLESRYHTKIFILIGIFAAIGISSYAIYKRIKVIKDILK